MPELPEVEALRDFLGDHLVGKEIARVLPLAISVLKTYDPPVTELEGAGVSAVARHGKFLDITAGDLHLLIHLARAGWLQWKDGFPATPPRPGKGPLALRTVLTGGDGFDLTEMGTTKRLAVHLVRDPAEVPGVARLGPDPLADSFDRDAFAAVLGGARRQIKGALRDQSLIAGIGNAYSDEILHVAKMSPFKLTSALGDEDVTRLYDAMRTTLQDAVERSAGSRRAGSRPRRRAACASTAGRGSPAPSAATPCWRCRSATPRSSTAPPVRPVASP